MIIIFLIWNVLIDDCKQPRRRSFPVALGTTSAADSRNSQAKSPAIRFSVRSLGWVEIAEDDLTPERSSKAVNRCIVDLSLGRNDLLDVVGRWGDVSSFIPF